MVETATKFRAGETPTEAVRRLEAEARDIAGRAADALITDLILIAGRCGDVGDLGSVPVGVREIARRLGETINAEVEKAQGVQAREGRP